MRLGKYFTGADQSQSRWHRGACPGGDLCPTQPQVFRNSTIITTKTSKLETIIPVQLCVTGWSVVVPLIIQGVARRRDVSQKFHKQKSVIEHPD